MRKCYFLIVIIILTTVSSLLSQNGLIDSLKIYAIKWDAQYTFARNNEGLKQFPLYCFQSNGAELNTFFLNFDDCVSKLHSGDSIAKGGSLRALVSIVFSDGKTVDVSFDSDGNYFFQQKWYKVNSEFYYTIFKFFSNEIVSDKTLQKCKKKYRGPFWYK